MSFGVIGAGSPLVDYTVAVDEEFLQSSISGSKGGTVHICDREREQIFSKLAGRKIARTPGGAAANTICALGRLGIRSAFCGRIGEDEDGEFFVSELRRSRVAADYIFRSSTGSTGYCLSLVTEDAERTMRSNLGVSTQLGETEFERCDFKNFNWLLCEGYMLQTPEFYTIFDRAKAAGCAVALDFSSPEIAAAIPEKLDELLTEKVDMVLCNDAEAAAFTGCSDPVKNLLTLSGKCRFAAVKLGADGSLIKAGNEPVLEIAPVMHHPAVDTTAAGDHYAAGLFYGLSRNWSWRSCGEFASLLGGTAAAVSGSRVPEELWQEIFRAIDHF